MTAAALTAAVPGRRTSGPLILGNKQQYDDNYANGRIMLTMFITAMTVIFNDKTVNLKSLSAFDPSPSLIINRGYILKFLDVLRFATFGKTVPAGYCRPHHHHLQITPNI